MRPRALRSNELNIGLRPLVKAMSLGLGLSALPLPAHAILIDTDSYALSGATSVTDPLVPAGATTGSFSSITSVDQFDATLGVLLGTTINLTSTRTQTISGAGTDTAKSKDTLTGSGTTTGTSLSAPGGTAVFGNLNLSGNCNANGSSCTFGPTADAGTATNATLSIALGSLDTYVGGGTVNVTRSAGLSDTTTESTAGQFTGTSSSTYKLDWTGKLGVQYDYQLHAAQSFDAIATQLVLNLDLGTVLQNSVDPTAGFKIYNLAGDRVGLDLDKITVSGDDPQLTTDLATFAALAAGGFMSFTAVLDTATVGSFAETYTLFLSDANVGAPASRLNNYTLTLNLTGAVVPDVIPSVPEPGTLGLLGAGMLGLGWLRRRRRR
jgi:hypothetical protein